MTTSRYTYIETSGKDTEVLINNQNLRTHDELESFEKQMTANRLIELENNPYMVKGNFDLAHLCEIHKFIFGDVYPTSEKEMNVLSKKQNLSNRRYFVGRLREEDIFKGGFRFIPALYVESGLMDLFRELQQENFLKNESLETFPKRLAYYMAELNVIHPFREGNGRSNREFIRQLALHAGYKLEWSKLDAKELLHASIRSVVDTSLLEVQLKNALSK